MIILCILFLVLSFLGCTEQMDISSKNETSVQDENDAQNSSDLENHTTQNNNTVIVLDGIKINNYTTTTYWRTGCCGVYDHHNESGFYHQLPIWSNASYIITGIIENTNEFKVDQLNINILFMNAQQEKLFDLIEMDKSLMFNQFLPDEKKNFSVKINPIEYYSRCNMSSYQTVFSLFNEIESFRFEIDFNT